METIKMRFQTVFLLAAVVCIGARVIQEGEENATCFPEDFEAYRWVLANNTWFAETGNRVSWLKALDECAKIEPGRTSLGGPRNVLENTRLKTHFHDGLYYFNAVQIGGRKWYWFTQKIGKPIIMESIKWSNWFKGQPDNEGESCGELATDQKKWNDRSCSANSRGICELRCDSL